MHPNFSYRLSGDIIAETTLTTRQPKPRKRSLAPRRAKQIAESNPLQLHVELGIVQAGLLHLL